MNGDYLIKDLYIKLDYNLLQREVWSSPSGPQTVGCCERTSFWSPNPGQVRNHKPKPAQAWHLFL